MIELRRKGFTLIELLVVIAIMAILAAILFPVLITAKERARQIGCLSNLKQFGGAFRSYCDDWDSILPIARLWETRITGKDNWAGTVEEPGPGGTPTTYVWRGAIYRYVKNRAIYLCPSDRNRGSPRDPTNVIRNYPISYRMNGLLSWRNCETMQRLSYVPNTTYYAVGGGTPGTGIRRNRLSQIMVLIHQNREEGSRESDCNWWDGSTWTSNGYAPDSVHFDGTTILYADWHAKWQSTKAGWAAIRNFEWHPDL